MNNHEKRKQKVVKGTLKPKAKIVRAEDVDMSDLDKVASVNIEKGWMSQEVLDVSDFSFS